MISVEEDEGVDDSRKNGVGSGFIVNVETNTV